jgi:hypothetical protein
MAYFLFSLLQKSSNCINKLKKETMNKKLFLIIFIGIVGSLANAQPLKIDTVAVSILDHMSAVIGDLSSCAVTINSNYDVHSKELGLIKHSDQEKLYLHGPDKLMVEADGDKGSREFFYNGKLLSYYSFDKNQFGQIACSSPVVDMIDSVNKSYGIDFPAADFFYPSFVDDIISEAKGLVFLGITKVNNKDCFHIAGTAKDKTFQFWISNDAFYLPMKMVIVYTGREMNPQYEAVLSDWQINPSLPDALFEFTAPPKAKKIKLVALSLKK